VADASSILELWKPVTAAPAYEVSTWGRVRRGEFDVATWTNKGGYTCVNLEVPGQARPRTFYVHRLVLLAFSPPRTLLANTVNHENGHKPENHLGNLTWMTPADQAAHARALGLRPDRPPAATCRYGHQKAPGRHCLRCRRVTSRRRRHGPARLLELAEGDAGGGTIAA
jgi:hypothetical protein